jgi:gluconate kinase
LKDYEVLGYVFECSDKEIHKKRLMSRQGKTIPAYILSSMKLEEPSLDEGFSQITKIVT